MERKITMEQVQLEATMRKEEEVGKKFAGRLRKEGLIPAVVYEAGRKTVPIALNARAFLRALHTSAGENVIIELKISSDGAKPQTRTVLIKEIQHHPYKDDIVHVDFHKIALDEMIKVKVAIAAKGEAMGVTRDAGILERIMWEIEIECLPMQIPEKIEIDVTDLEVGHTKTIKDLNVPPGVKILADPEQIVVSVSAKKAVEEVVAAPETEAAEPEVIREKKPEEEAVAEGEAAPPAEKKQAKEEKK